MADTETPVEWTYCNRTSGYVRTEPMALMWEASGDPLSDDFTPDEITAEELLARWVRWFRHNYPDVDDVPISWYVEPAGEFAPFQTSDDGDDEDFLTFFTWPRDADGERLRWTRLPVQDKLWYAEEHGRPMRADKGGFIQQATGWKPAPFQRTVHLPTLLTAANFGHRLR